MSLSMSASLLEQARRHARGESANPNDWNVVTVGDKTFSMEFPFAEKTTKKVDISYTSAFIKTENKGKCELCTMWFDKKSIKYKVPNHRILALRKQWGYHQTGKRYSSASYLYGNSMLCVFCAQLFASSTKTFTIEDSESDVSGKSTLLYTTPISRKDITQEGCRTYQSSEVDAHHPSYAIAEPYAMGAKTRREADAWWEIDLGKTQHVHSVSLSMKGALHEKIEVYILLLKGPVGFEDPFLENLLATAVGYNNTFLNTNLKAKKENVKWELPAGAKGGAVRVQIKGFHTLHLFRLQVFQGDDIITDPEPVQLDIESMNLPYPDEVKDRDTQLRYDSFASYPPQTFATTKSSVCRGVVLRAKTTSPKKKRLDPGSSMLDRVGAAVGTLNAKYASWNGHVREWISRALDGSRHFTLDELIGMRDIIFNTAVASAESNGNSPPKSPTTLLRRTMHRPQSPENRLGGVVRAQDMFGPALLETSPRCDVDNLMKTLKATAILMQGRDQGGSIGLLQSSPRFMFFSSEEYEVLLNLKIVFQFIKAQDKKKEKAYFSSLDTNSQQSQSIFTIDTESVLVEASWSQFVIIMWMLSLGKPEEIPPLAYNITENLHVLHAEIGSASEARMSPQKAAMAMASAAAGSSSPPRAGTPLDDDWDHVGGGGEGFFETARRPTSRGSDLMSSPGATPVGSPGKPVSSKRMTMTAGEAVARAATPQGRDKASSRQFNQTAPAAAGRVDLGRSRSFVGGSSMERASTARERAKNHQPSLTETYKNEALANLGLNFGHAQYKLDRISLNVDTDVMPRHLRTRLTPVTFQDLPVDSLQLGVKSTDELFEIGGNLSPMGVAPPMMQVLPLEKQSQSAKLLAKRFNKRRAQTVSVDSKPSQPSTDILGLFSEHDDCRQNSTITLQSLDAGSNSYMVSDRNGDNYMKNCFLCMHRFPTKSMPTKVLLKHIVNLRRGWDPKLVEKFNGDLSLGMGLFNLVPVCFFCSQFFDPDLENGVSAPSKSSIPAAAAKKWSGSKRQSQGRKSKALTEYYDQRYSGLKGAGELLRDSSTVETRARAKRAIEICKQLKKEQSSGGS